MDIYALLEQLEQLANGSKKIRFSNRVMIDEDELLELVDQLRTAIPDEIRQAKRMLAERERIISGAQAEAEKIIQTAEVEAGQMVDRDKAKVAAEEQARRLIQEANTTADSIRSGADEYAVEVLQGLEQTLASFLGHIRNGLSELESDRRRKAG